MESVEAVFKKNPILEQIWVYGNSFESCLVAVVVPAEVPPGGPETRAPNLKCPGCPGALFACLKRQVIGAWQPTCSGARRNPIYASQ